MVAEEERGEGEDTILTLVLLKVGGGGTAIVIITEPGGNRQKQKLRRNRFGQDNVGTKGTGRWSASQVHIFTTVITQQGMGGGGPVGE